MHTCRMVKARIGADAACASCKTHSILIISPIRLTSTVYTEIITVYGDRFTLRKHEWGLPDVNTQFDFIYNEERREAIGENSHKVYKIGDKVKIKVIDANKLLRRIDFEIV